MGITREQALDCLLSDDLIGMGMEADAVRRRLHPEGVVCYAIDHRIDLTQRSTEDLEPILQDAADAIDDGATGITLLGTKGPGLEKVARLLIELRQRLPMVRLHLLSVGEILTLARTADLSADQVAQRLRGAGLDAVLGGEDVDLVDRADLMAVHRAAHRAGLQTVAAMSIGGRESMPDRVAFLEELHALQQETGGFMAFTLTVVPAASGRTLDDATAVEYLKTLAVARMVLENIVHVQSNWDQQGNKVLQMGLRFGGNDLGSLRSAGSLPEEEARRVIRDAGFRPVQRDTLFRSVFLH